MGIHQLPRVEDYWSTDDRLGVPGIAKLMPLNRYRKLNQYIHIAGNEAAPDPNDSQRDRLFKIRPLLDMCNERFSCDVYRPHCEMSIDEAMIGFISRDGVA
jgi:hypothetical protein